MSRADECRERCMKECGDSLRCARSCCERCCNGDGYCATVCTGSLGERDMARVVLWLLVNDRCPFCGRRVKWMHADMKPDGRIIVTDFECPRCGRYTLKDGRYVRLKPGELRYRIIDAVARLWRWVSHRRTLLA